MECMEKLLIVKSSIIIFISTNSTGLQGFVVENLWVVSGVIFDV